MASSHFVHGIPPRWHDVFLQLDFPAPGTTGHLSPTSETCLAFLGNPKAAPRVALTSVARGSWIVVPRLTLRDMLHLPRAVEGLKPNRRVAASACIGGELAGAGNAPSITGAGPPGRLSKCVARQIAGHASPET